jgi:hypothetical protein
MNFKKGLIFLVVFAFTAVAVFAWEGYYKASDGETIALMGTGSAWGMQLFDSNGNRGAYYESLANFSVSNTSDRLTFYISVPSGRMQVIFGKSFGGGRAGVRFNGKDFIFSHGLR